MTRQQILGMGLLAAVPVIIVILLLCGVKLADVGPEVIVAQGGTPASQWTESQAAILLNWPAILPLVLVALVGMSFLLVIRRHKGRDGEDAPG
jgi:hypothetical protein